MLTDEEQNPAQRVKIPEYGNTSACQLQSELLWRRQANS